MRLNIPLTADDPIQAAVDAGLPIISLFSLWGFVSADAVYRLKRFDYTPPPKTAARMAETFGPAWTAGAVIDHWMPRVQAKADAEAKKDPAE